MDAQIRQATRADVPRVLALWDRARSPAAVTPDTQEGLSVLLDRDPGALLVAERDGAIIGTLIAAFDGWRGGMYRLAVESEDRRKGIARELVAAGERRLAELGARRVSALVGTEDELAAALWVAVGYERDPQIARFVKNL